MRIDEPLDVLSLVGPVARRKRENFGIILLDTRRNVIAKKVMFQGTVNSCIVGIRELLIYALKKDAVGIILFHNHPSGNTEPSKKDEEITRELQKGCKTVGLQLVDHIIVGRYGCNSLRSLGFFDKKETEERKVAEQRSNYDF